MRKFLRNSLAAALVVATCSGASAQNHDFEGSYVMGNFYVEYASENYSMDDLPLVIGAGNIIDNFANYTPFTRITGLVEGNTFTFTSEDEYLILDIDWDTFHYLVLNGETYGDEFEKAPITITYNPDYDEYVMSSWMLWDYDPFSGEFEKIATCMVFSLVPGEIQDEVDYTGEYVVKGTRTVYTDGVASESQEEFLMAMQPDGTGLYEFTEFAGYEVGLVPRGWLGVYGAVYGTDIELQGTDITLNAEGDGIKLAGPFAEYDDMYTVTVFFNTPDSGIVSDFSVWRMEAGEPVELLAKWSYLTFTRGGVVNRIETAVEEDETPVYYDLRGVRVANPSDGIYIMRKGGKTSKVIIRN